MDILEIKQKIKSSLIIPVDIKEKLLKIESYNNDVLFYLNKIFSEEINLLTAINNNFFSIIVNYILYLEEQDKKNEEYVFTELEQKLKKI